MSGVKNHMTEVKSHMSHVRSQESHARSRVTCQKSRVTHQKSRVTCQKSRVTCQESSHMLSQEESQVTCEKLAVTINMSGVKKQRKSHGLQITCDESNHESQAISQVSKNSVLHVVSCIVSNKPQVTDQTAQVVIQKSCHKSVIMFRKS